MNILYVITKAERGGAQQHVRDLAVCLKSNHHVHVGIGESSGWLFEELRREGIATTFVPLKRGWNPFAFFGFAIQLSQLIWHVQPDIVHLHSSHTLLGAWIVRLFFHPAKSVITLHGLSLLADSSPSAINMVPRPRFHSLAKFIYKIYLSISLRAADSVICVSDADVQIVKKLFPFVLLQTIHNGIESPAFLSRVDARARLKLSLDAFVIGTLGRFAYPKNQAMLLEAFSKCRNVNAVLCLLGEGPDHDRLIARANDLDIRDRVIFAHGDATLLPAFDLFVLPSLFEGFPYVLLEAALARVPVIATDVGGVSELIIHKKTGLLIEAGDLVRLTQEMDELEAQPETSRMYADAAYDRVLSDFSRERMCKQTVEVYQNTISTVEPAE